MNVFEKIWQVFGQASRQARSLPQAIVAAARKSQRQSAGKEFEAERLDRLRNPAKYLGK